MTYTNDREKKAMSAVFMLPGESARTMDCSQDEDIIMVPFVDPVGISTLPEFAKFDIGKFDVMSKRFKPTGVMVPVFAKFDVMPKRFKPTGGLVKYEQELKHYRSMLEAASTNGLFLRSHRIRMRWRRQTKSCPTKNTQPLT